MSSQFSISTKRDGQGRYAIIQTDGYVNNAAGERISVEAQTLMAEGFRYIAIDMAKSTVINSIGISILIEILEQMQEKQGALVFCNLTKTIAKTFTIMGLAQYAPIFDSEQEAIRALLDA